MLGHIKRFGFTMIELLIVISVLGILAVAVLAAINPIEQINRGRDTGSRSDAEQLLSAIDRFYAQQGYYPWQTGAGDTTNPGMAWTAVVSAADDASPVVPVLTKLSSGGTSEIKQSFVERVSATTYNTLYLYNEGTQGDSTYVCFLPKSGAFKEEATTRCTAGLPDDASAIEATVCNTDAGSYYICLP